MPTDTTTHQTLAAGTPVAQRYQRRIGSPITREITDPGTCHAMLAGKPGTGKTNIFLTNPDAYIINADRSQLPVLPPNAPLADVWPTKDATGAIIDADGSPFVMQWENIQAMVAILIEMSEANEPRPKTIVLDTIAGLVNLGIDKIVRDSDRDQWRDLDGRWAWDKLYTMIIDLGLVLKAHGYGIWWVCHVVDKVLDLPGSEGKQKIVSLTITDNFWARLFWQLDYVGILVQETAIENVAVEQTGGGRVRTVRVPQEVVRHVMTVSRPEYTGIAKTRVPMPDTPLSRENAWSDFRTSYLASAQ